MKALSSIVLVLAIIATAILPSDAAADKLLQNVRGDVSYQQGSGSAKPLASKANIALSDSDTAITGGGDSLGAISLPDSSRILMGPNSKVTLSAFDQTPNLTTAKFVVFGKTKFVVEHPGGAKANYTFQTTTGQIAVRGTEGDILQDDKELKVAVYQVTDPNLPVEVNLNNGQHFTLRAGQELTVAVAGAVIAAASIAAVSQTTVASSTASFGAAPGTGGGAAGSAGAAGASGASSASAAGAAGGAGGGAAGAAAAAAAVGAGAAATGHHGGGGANPTPPPGAISLSKTAITLSSKNKKATFTIAQNNGPASYSVTSSDTSVATVPSTCAISCTVTAATTAGSSLISVSDGQGNSSSLNVTLKTGPITFNPASVSFNVGATPAPVVVTDPFFTGTLQASITGSTSGVATVQPSSGKSGATFMVIPGTQTGNADLSVTDGYITGQMPITASASLSANPDPIPLGNGNPSQTVTVSVPGYTGSVSATANSTGDVGVTVTPKSAQLNSQGTASFTVALQGGASSSSGSGLRSHSSSAPSVTFTAGHAQITDPVSVTFGTLNAQPTSLGFTLGVGKQSKDITVSETYYIGAFQITNTPSFVKVTYQTLQGPQSVITVKAVAPGGPAPLTITDINGASATVQISVSPSPAPTSTSIPICINLRPNQNPFGTTPGVPPNMHPDHVRAGGAGGGHQQAPAPTATPSCPPSPTPSPGGLNLPVRPPAPAPAPPQNINHGAPRPPSAH